MKTVCVLQLDLKLFSVSFSPPPEESLRHVTWLWQWFLGLGKACISTSTAVSRSWKNTCHRLPPAPAVQPGKTPLHHQGYKSYQKGGGSMSQWVNTQKVKDSAPLNIRIHRSARSWGLWPLMPTNGPQEPLGKEKKSTQANARCGRRYYPIDNDPDKELQVSNISWPQVHSRFASWTKWCPSWTTHPPPGERRHFLPH